MTPVTRTRTLMRRVRHSYLGVFSAALYYRRSIGGVLGHFSCGQLLQKALLAHHFGSEPESKIFHPAVRKYLLRGFPSQADDSGHIQCIVPQIPPIYFKFDDTT